jgi:hypothetical protein
MDKSMRVVCHDWERLSNSSSKKPGNLSRKYVVTKHYILDDLL